MNDWKEKAVNAYNAQQAEEETRRNEDATKLAHLREWATGELVRAIFGGPVIGLDGVKFKAVLDRSKPAEDVSSWELYMAVWKRANQYDEEMQWDWFGPVRTLEGVGLYLSCDPRVLIPPGYHYQREPEDFGDDAPKPKPKEDYISKLMTMAASADADCPPDSANDRFFLVLLAIAESLRWVGKEV
jgi:hypothetical protein